MNLFNYQSLIFIVASKGNISELDFNREDDSERKNKRVFKWIDFRFNTIVLLDTNDQVTIVNQQPFRHNVSKILVSEPLSPIAQVDAYMKEHKNVNIVQVSSDYGQKDLALLMSDHTVIDICSSHANVRFFKNPDATNPFVKLTSGGSFNILQTLNGNELYGYGSNYWHVLDDKQQTGSSTTTSLEHIQPVRIHSQLQNITHVACGWDGLFVVCNHRKLYVVGRNLSHCLGLPGHRVQELKSCAIPILDDETIVKICSCDETSLILLSSGTVLFNNARACFERMDSQHGPFKDIGTMRDVNIFLTVGNRLFIAKSPSARPALRELVLPCHTFTTLELHSGEYSTVLHFKLESKSVDIFRSKLLSANDQTLLNDVSVMCQM